MAKKSTSKWLVLPGTDVVKHNNLIRTKINISNVDASRLLAHFIACIPDLTESETAPRYNHITYDVRATDVLKDTSGYGYSRIKEIIRELAKATVELEKPNPKGGHPIFEVTTFFMHLSYKDGIIHSRFNPEMKPYLMALKSCFTQYNLLEYIRLPSIYSQRIFEILQSWKNIKSGEVNIPIEDLHRQLNTPPSLRTNFKDFRYRVLEKAHKDINNLTNFEYDWEPVKVGRSVEQIRFFFSGKRRAIAQQEHDKLKKEKQTRLNNQRFHRALDCLKENGGDCREPTNKPIICKLCKRICWTQKPLH